MPRNYKRTGIPRGPKPRIYDAEIIQQVYDRKDMGCKIKAICDHTGLKYYDIKKILADRELHDRDAIDIEIAALDDDLIEI